MKVDPRIEKIEQDLMDQGLIVEAGWMGFRLMCLPINAPANQVDALRNAFFAGAQHLFGSILCGLDDDPQETADDLRRMDNIQKELDKFLVEFKARHGLG